MTMFPQPHSPLTEMKPEDQLLLLSARLHFDDQTARRYHNILLGQPTDSEPAILNQESRLSNPESKILNLEPGILNRAEGANPKPKTQNPKPEALDWEYILTSAQRLGIAPILHKHLSTPQFRKNLPTHAHQTLKTAYRNAAFKSLRIQAQIHQLNQAAAERQIPIIFLKGAALSGWLYEDTALRPMGDIDILCPKTHNPEIDILLKNLGYTQNLSIYKTPVHKMMGEKMSHLAPYTRPNALSIEVHNYLFGDHSIEKDIWQNGWFRLKRPNPIPILKSEWMLLHLCLHLAKHINHASYTLYWLSDLIEFLRKHQEKLDIPHFLQLTNTLKSTNKVYEILALATRYGNLGLRPELCAAKADTIKPPTLLLDSESKNQQFLEGLINQKQTLFKKVYTEYGPLAALYYGLRILFPPKQYIMNKFGQTTRTQFLGHYLFHSYGRFKNAFMSSYLHFVK